MSEDRRCYLNASMITEGLGATVDGIAREEEVTINKEQKTMFRIPLKLDKKVRDEYNKSDTDEVSWAAGKNAKALLVEALQWPSESWIGVHGTFHPRPWQASYNGERKSGFAWHFIPDNHAGKEEHQKQEEEQDNGKEIGEDTKEGTTLFSCSKCGRGYEDADELKYHVKKKHPRRGSEAE